MDHCYLIVPIVRKGALNSPNWIVHTELSIEWNLVREPCRTFSKKVRKKSKKLEEKVFQKKNLFGNFLLVGNNTKNKKFSILRIICWTKIVENSVMTWTFVEYFGIFYILKIKNSKDCSKNKKSKSSIFE